ncbi:MAG: acyl-CoA/acyl-ACP dehydrogenase [Dehalococcoidales bacterium]|nr:acyl-CoA/acyl-ACP dehydrogenase [Dehalococcoidales bacterium]
MNLKLSEEQEMLRTMAKDFLTNKYPKTVVKEILAGESGYSPESWKEMAELGWQGLIIPDKYGGNGMTFQDLAILLEEMGKACLPAPFFATVLLGAYPIIEAGTEEQKQEYLSKIASGKAIFTLALNEIDGLYEATSIATKAAADGDSYVINGIKLFVPSANVADYMLVVARTGNGADPEAGITLFIVDAKSEGIKVNVLKTIDDEKLCEVILNNVKVPKANILGKLDGGWVEVKNIIERAAAAKCADMVGTLQGALDMTVQYAKDRKQFDQPIGKFQIIQHYCTNMATDVEGLRFATNQAVWLKSEGLPCAREVSIAKAWAGEATDRVTALAHQIHGAIGVTIDHDLQYFTKRVKAAVPTFGDGDYHREIVAKEMGL